MPGAVGATLGRMTLVLAMLSGEEIEADLEAWEQNGAGASQTREPAEQE